jgi:hypothetical protein
MSDDIKKNEGGVTLSQAQYDALMTRLAKVEGGYVADPDEKIIPTCHVLLHEGMPISDVRKAHRVGTDPTTGNELMECEIDVVESLKADGTPVLKTLTKIPYSAMRNESERVNQAPIVRLDVEPVVKDHGTVEVKQADDWRMLGTGVRVPMRVKSVLTTFIVAMPSEHDALLPKFLGKEIALNTVNI